MALGIFLLQRRQHPAAAVHVASHHVQPSFADVTAITHFLQVVIQVLVQRRMLRTDHGVVAVAAAGALDIVADAEVVVRRASGVAVASNGRAVCQGANHLPVVLEDRDGLGPPGRDVAAVLRAAPGGLKSHSSPSRASLR